MTANTENRHENFPVINRTPNYAPLQRYAQGYVGNIPANTQTTLLTPLGVTKLGLVSLVLYNPTAATVTIGVYIRATVAGVVAAADVTNELVNEPLAARSRFILSGSPLLVLPNGALVSVVCSASGMNAWATAEVSERDR